MEDTGCVCSERITHRVRSSSLTTPFSFHSPPSTVLPTPLTPGRTAEGQSERKRREAKGETGVGCLDVHEHAERRERGQAMTTMLSPKIRQTRRGRTWLALLSYIIPASCISLLIFQLVSSLTGADGAHQLRGRISAFYHFYYSLHNNPHAWRH